MNSPDGQVIAIDGKTLRRSFDAACSKAAIHMVSAWATANSISFGQLVVDEKTNEITAIPKLLEILDISGCLVTIDAMGCQSEIAQRIVDGRGRLCAGRERQPAEALRGDPRLFHRATGRRSAERAHRSTKRTRRDMAARTIVIITWRNCRMIFRSPTVARTEGDGHGGPRDRT